MHSFVADHALDIFADIVRRRMAEKGWIRKQLADHAAVSDGVVGKVLAGKSVHNNNVIKIARVLEVEAELGKLIGPAPALPSHGPQQADADHGAYLRSEVTDFIGQYIGYRKGFEKKGTVVRSLFELHWSDLNSRLEFIETQQQGRHGRAVSNTHAGGVYLSRHFALIQLLTRFQGALRLVTLHRPHFGSDDLRGVVLTQIERKVQGGPAYFVPGVSPIYLQRLASPISNIELGRICGVMPADDADLEQVRTELTSIGASYVARPEE